MPKIFKYADEIRNHVQNIEYFTAKIKETVQKQINEDAVVNMGLEIKSARFENLGTIACGGEAINVYCEAIKANVKLIENQCVPETKKEEVISEKFV